MDKIDTIMIFAAGFGKRMQHLTHSKPKPLLKIAAVPILYYVLQLVQSYPFKQIIINTHHCHQQIADAVEKFKKLYPSSAKIVLINEAEILETGGGVKNAYPIIGDKPIFTCNSDVIIQSHENIFTSLLEIWDPVVMNFLLLLQPIENAIAYAGSGDFERSASGKLYRNSGNRHNYVYAGISIIKPSLIYTNSSRVFSLKDYYLNDDKVYGHYIPECKWYHASTPEDLSIIEKHLSLSSF